MSKFRSSWIDRNMYYEHQEGSDPPIYRQYERPQIVCLCGSTKFWKQFQEANLYETLKGNIVLSIGGATSSDGCDKTFGGLIEESDFEVVKKQLDKLHFRKIDLADRVVILNVGGYIGESTRKELEYAKHNGKIIDFLEDSNGSDQTKTR